MVPQQHDLTSNSARRRFQLRHFAPQIRQQMWVRQLLQVRLSGGRAAYPNRRPIAQFSSQHSTPSPRPPASSAPYRRSPPVRRSPHNLPPPLRPKNQSPPPPRASNAAIVTHVDHIVELGPLADRRDPHCRAVTQGRADLYVVANFTRHLRKLLPVTFLHHGEAVRQSPRRVQNRAAPGIVVVIVTLECSTHPRPARPVLPITEPAPVAGNADARPIADAACAPMNTMAPMSTRLCRSLRWDGFQA